MKKHIYIYSPSGAVRDKAAFKRGLARLTALGHEVEVDPDALASCQRFAGDDATRLAAIHRAAASGADVALISRGGYGLTRILPGIRYKQVAKAIDQGMAFVGISDFTAFQNAVLAKTGALTWAGPALCEGFGVGGKPDADGHGAGAAPAPDDIMEACFDDLLQGQGEGSGWRQTFDKRQNAIEYVASNPNNKRAEDALSINNSVLWGGNLTVLTSLLGTAYFPNIKGGVLFLEDVAEHPYRIERMLTQLLHAGVLQRQKAVLLGQFTDYKLVSHDRGFKLQSVIDWVRQQARMPPIITNLPYGHVQTKVLLPVGAKVDLGVQGRDVMLVWGHLGSHH